MSKTRAETMAGMPVYRVSTLLFNFYFRLWNRLQVRGVEHVPETGGMLLATNHASFLDPAIIGASLRARPILFLARDSLWKSRFGKWWMDRVGCIPVSRGTGDMRALRKMIERLKNGSCVALFPEGTRTEDGEIQDAKGGAGFIVEKSGCSVVPAYIDGTYKAHPKGARWIKPVKITIIYGAPITPEEFAALGTGREAYDKYTTLIMQRIAQLKAEPSQPTRR
ncbi:MAG: 1-acyl-sn-glycerol-3-phosphate acyltransferase [Kiritimatiellales bacterium]|nr:1-acyl-sn-glycerol-3-phosphate acyltransferase [Kiritimatiellales bacterium]